MTQHQHAAAADAKIAYARHQDAFEDLMGLVASAFPRRETRTTFREMTQGMLMELEDVNCWTLAEAIGHSGPHRLQHLLSRASWDDRAVLDAATHWAAARLDDGDGVLIADETGDEKTSTDAVGAGYQHSGSLGGVGLCQVAVHLSYATSRGHTILDRALYLPKDWAEDEERRELVGVPEELTFTPKTDQAADLLKRAVTAGVRAAFFTADEVYGSRDLRRTCRELGLGYAIAVRSNHRATTQAGPVTCKNVLKLIPATAWRRMRTGTGGKGVRDYDWAMVEVTADDTPTGDDPGTSVLLARRHRYTRTVSYFRCWTPTPVPLARLVAVVCLRWRVEEDFQAAKNTVGLDKGQVTTWTSWHRWSTAALVAYAYLAVATARERDTAPTSDQGDVIPLTCHELLRLLRALMLPRPRRDLAHILHWSHWRRRHQYRARRSHLTWNTYADSTP